MLHAYESLNPGAAASIHQPKKNLYDLLIFVPLPPSYTRTHDHMLLFRGWLLHFMPFVFLSVLNLSFCLLILRLLCLRLESSLELIIFTLTFGAVKLLNKISVRDNGSVEAFSVDLFSHTKLFFLLPYRFIADSFFLSAVIASWNRPFGQDIIIRYSWRKDCFYCGVWKQLIKTDGVCIISWSGTRVLVGLTWCVFIIQRKKRK